jgi:hypothetical protein
MAERFFRWWFENRETGEITIGQFPNWPLWGIGATLILDVFVDSGSDIGEVLPWIRLGLWVYWAGDELVRGVNPWRRLLGTAVLAWQAVSLLTG